jgi:hypothetical protein
MINKVALDKFAIDLGLGVRPGTPADVVVKHYKPILGAIAGAYLLSKIIPGIYNYAHSEKEEQNQALENYYLQNIAASEASQAGPIQPRKDMYNYL